ncbi:hypothetical protein JI57_02310 [Psychromonas sp. PRT-SC03]|nr:hypothetical protein JI57_02310 [Psychromonas sp. PRT-SC03]
MPRIFYLLEKECLEYPVVIRLPFFLLILGLLILSYFIFVLGDSANISFEIHSQGIAMPTQMPGFSDGVFGLISMATGVLSLLLTFLYLPKTFLKTRQEGSLMFWRSMPVSDLLDHSVKLVFALILIPLICSLVLLSAELFLYLVSLFKSSSLLSFFGPITLGNIFVHYFSFIEKMLWLSLATLPMACLLLCLSQWLNAPLLVFFVTYYIIQVLMNYVFNLPSIGLFVEQFSRLPLDILFSNDTLQSILEVGLLSFGIAYLFAGACLLLSLQKSKYGQ